MYKIIEEKNLGNVYLVLSNSDSSSSAKICLNEGARLTTFTFNNTEIITHVTPSIYKEDFASAILFPFANRVKNGIYNFNNVQYKLECNEKSKENAIHGLVYNKSFSLIKSDQNSDFASAKLIYKEREGCDGFPFKYSIILNYTLNENGFSLEVAVKNEDDKPFPFTLGWHPYFLSSNLYKSKLQFNSNKKLISDASGIVIGAEQLDNEKPMILGDRMIDDTYIIESNKVKFTTPDYLLQLKSSALDNFLQIYTPSSVNMIAIEPMTGVSDSFNNNIGKKILNPKEDFHIEWQLRITNLKGHK